MMIRSSVVLPQPDWPMMPTTDPRGIERLTSFSTGRAASYPNATSFISTMGSCCTA